jgi:transmembrane sensor
MDEDKLKRLLYQYFDNSIDPEDCIELIKYIDANPEKVSEILDNQSFNLNKGPMFEGQDAGQVFQRIKSDNRFNTTEADHSQRRAVIKFFQKRWFTIAAIFLVCFFIALFKILSISHNFTNNVAKNNNKVIIMPGGNKATLTLSNNQVIVLNNAANRVLAKAGVYNAQGKLVYNNGQSGSSSTTDENAINTLSTPRGGQYQLVLADGTKVWLNSASSISYPVEFKGNERRVKLIGEAYFEVAKNKDKPFYVDMNDAHVRVFGTHFNIAAYNNDDNITTTLLEGSVQVTKNGSMSMLKPGQQAVVFNANNNIQVSPADIEQAMAWKNGYFIFNDENITAIMKRVSRWYDVDIDYQDDIKDQQFGGIYDRSKSLSDLLHYLEKLGKVHFEIQERRVVVMK